MGVVRSAVDAELASSDDRLVTMASPGSGWDLTAPESLVLRDGPRADRSVAVKLGLLELVTRRSLRLVDIPDRGWFGRPKVEKVLARGTEPLPRTGALAPIATAFLLAPEKRHADGTAARSVKDLARAFASGKRTRGNRYISDILMPELGARGLYSRRDDRVLGLFPRTRWFLTSDGERRRRELIDLLASGEQQLGAAVGRDPRAVASTLATAGAATLLMTSMYPELSDLSRRLRQEFGPGDGGGIATTIGVGGDADQGTPSAPDSTLEPSHSPTPDFGDEPGAFDTFDSGAFGDLDLSAFDGVDSAFDAIDSGVDAGGDGGSGDGGDGGGGGD